MTKGKKQIIIYQVLLLIVGIGVSVYYGWCLSNVSIPFHSDDAGSTFEIMNRMYFTGAGESNLFDIFGALTNFATFAFGINEFSTLLPFYIGFFLRFYLASNILISAKQDKPKIFMIKLLFMVWCSALLGVEGNAEITASKFHMGPSIIILLIVLIYSKVKKIWIQRSLTIILLILAMLQTDRVLSAIVCVIPVVLFYLFKPLKNILQNRNMDKRKTFLIGATVIFICFVCGILNLYMQFSGHTFSSSDVYGSRIFSSLQDIINNSSTFFQGIFGMFNCQVVGEPIISVLFIPRFIKCIVLCATMVYIIFYFIKCLKKETFDESKLLICITAIITFLAFVMTGSQHGQISIRYCNIMLFIFPIMAWTLLDSVWLWQKFKWSYKILLIVVLCISQINVVNHADVYHYDNIAKKLLDNGIETAMAPYWSSTVVTVVSEGAVQMQSCSLFSDKLRIFMNELALYKDKATKFETVITSSFQNEFYDDSGFNLTDESIPRLYGEPRQILKLDDYYNAYIYNYDLRTYPRRFEKLDTNRYCLSGPFMGDYRIDITCSFSDKLVFPEGVEVVEYVEKELGCSYLLHIANKIEQLVVEEVEGTEKSLEKYMTLKCIWEANSLKLEDGRICDKESPYIISNGTVKTEQQELKAGNYKLVLYGNDLSNVSVTSDCTMNQGDHGIKRLVYYIYLEQDRTVDFTIQSLEKCSITNISIEICESE